MIGLFFIPAVLGVIFARGSAFDDLRGSVEGECRYSASGVYVLDADTQATHVAGGGVPVAAPDGIAFAVPSGAQAHAITGTEIADAGIAFPTTPVSQTPIANTPVANHNGYGYIIDGVLYPLAFNQQSAPFTDSGNANYDTYHPYVECDPSDADTGMSAGLAIRNGNGYSAADYEPALAGNTFTPILRVLILFLPLLLVASAVVYIWSGRRASGARR